MPPRNVVRAPRVRPHTVPAICDRMPRLSITVLAFHTMTTPSSDTALVLFSGGQDSTTCLAWALQRYARVETIGFDYGQRHAIELEVRPTLL